MHLAPDALGDKDGQAGQEIALAPGKIRPRLSPGAPGSLYNSHSGVAFSAGRPPPPPRPLAARLQPLLLRADDGSPHNGCDRRDRRLGRRIRYVLL